MISKRLAGCLATGLIAVVAVGTSTVSSEKKDPPPKPLLVECIQPDYSKWESVKIGMSEVELTNLLGKPIAEIEHKHVQVTPSTEGSLRDLFFGRIKFNSPSTPESFDFYVLTHEGKVLQKGHPFGGELSRNGKPTTPVLIYPRDRTKFDHVPRFVDLRWQPSSGKYPIEYAVQIQYGQYEGRGANGKAMPVYNDIEDIEDLVCELPYAAFAFKGGQPGRWRVKAKNELGQSEWSEWRTFVFEQ